MRQERYTYFVADNLVERYRDEIPNTEMRDLWILNAVLGTLLALALIFGN